MRAQITKRRVAPYPVIEEFNELEDRYPGCLAAKVATYSNLALQSRDEALGDGVVQGRAHPTHRWHDSRFLQPLAKRESCVLLRSPIAMVDESRRRVPPAAPQAAPKPISSHQPGDPLAVTAHSQGSEF